MELTNIIKFLFPDLKEYDDFVVWNNWDGSDDYIEWKTDKYNQPTQEQLNIWWQQILSEREKSKKISEYQELEKQAVELRWKYLTAEMMPDSILKTKKLEDLTNKWNDITIQYEAKLQELISEYWEWIIDELVNV